MGEGVAKAEQGGQRLSIRASHGPSDTVYRTQAMMARKLIRMADFHKLSLKIKIQYQTSRARLFDVSAWNVGLIPPSNDNWPPIAKRWSFIFFFFVFQFFM